MKKLFFYLFAAITLTFTACDKDDDCEGDSLETTIIGNWKVFIAGLAEVGEIEFKANGDFTNDENLLIPEEIGGQPVTTKTYSVQSNSMFTLHASNSEGSSDFPLTVTSFECDEIKTNFQGLVEYTFRRQ